MRNTWAFGLLLSVAATTQAATPATKPAAGNPGATLRFPSFGISLPAPKGWVRVREQRDAIVVEWVKLDESQAKILGVLQVEIMPKGHSHFAEFAQETVRRLHAKMSDANTMLGGSPAMQFTVPAPAVAPKASDPSQLVAGRLTEHGGYYYGLFYLTPSGAGDIDDFQAVADGITWMDFVAPSEAVAHRSTSNASLFTLLDTNLAFVLPDPFRMSESNKTQVVYSTFDYVSNHSDAQVSIVKGTNNGVPLQKLETAVGESGVNHGWIGKPTWTNLRSNIGYCALMKRSGMADGKPLGPVQDLICVVGDGSFALFEFAYPDDEAAAKYATEIDAIAKSITIIHTVPGRTTR